MRPNVLVNSVDLWATVCKNGSTCEAVMSDRCLSVCLSVRLSCNVGLWPYG